VGDDVRVIHGDALDVLPTLGVGTIDAVITDPPYIIGGTSVGDPTSKSGTWADMMNASHWFATWYGMSWRLLRSTGFLISCGNWRSLPTMLGALAKAGIPATSCLVWDKEWIGTSYKNALRPTYELMVFSAKPEAEIPDRGASDIFRCKWMASNCKVSIHPAEKPIALMSHVIGLVTQSGDTILDPFAGSGSTLVAARKSGRRAIGIEIDERYIPIIDRRLADAATPLFRDEDAAHA
jgi:DNA modification methylase